jgi:L-cystine transport system permease protein
MGFDPGFMWIALQAGLAAAPATAVLSLSAFALSLVFGTIIAIIRVYRTPFFAAFFKICIDLIKAIPTVLILYILYFLIVDGTNLLAETLGLRFRSRDISVNTIAVIVLSFTGSVTVSETIRGSFLSVGQGQYEGGYSVGLTGWQTLRRIILPQVIPTALPVLCNNLIVFVKSSSIMFFIAVMDILNAAMVTATANYKFLEAYVAAALIYWAICFCIEQIAKLLERTLSRFRRDGV